LSFLPLAALFFVRGLRESRLTNYLVAALFAAMIALINFIAFYASVPFLVAILISEMALGEVLAKLRRAVIMALIAFGLCAFWFNVSFIRASFSFGEGPTVLHNLVTAGPFLLVLLLAYAGLFALCRRRPGAQTLHMSLLWFGSLGAIILSWYGFQLAISPQPNRYIPEWDMAFTLLVAALITWVYDHLEPRPGGRISRLLVTLGILISLGLLSVPFLRVAHAITRPGDGMEDSSEYQIARWFEEHTSREERVYVTGNTTFWLNLFSNVAQVRGGLDQSATNPWWDHAAYQINTGQDGSLAVLWAKAFNVRYILVNYPGSSDPYQDYAYPAKLEGLLPSVYERDGHSIFEVPLHSADLVLAVDSNKMGSVPPLRDGADRENLQRYVDVIEEGREVAYTWDGLGRFTVETEVREGEAILTRMTYDPGWVAKSDGRSVTVKADRLGFILLEPRPGEQVIKLSHGRVWDEFLGYGITVITVFALLAYGIRQLGSRVQRQS
jgi:YD repeat-containing protein